MTDWMAILKIAGIQAVSLFGVYLFMIVLSFRTYKQGKFTCVGLCLWKLGNKQVELWYCPRGLQIIEHKHPRENIELMFIFGHNSTFSRRTGATVPHQSAQMKWWHFGKTFSVKAGHYHTFTVSKFPLVFLNFETWLNGHYPTSASVDFELLEPELPLK